MNELWIEAEAWESGGPVAPVEAQEAKHDYAHEGYYVRLIPEVQADGVRRIWRVMVQWGRRTRPRCCVNKRVYVDEEPTVMWHPRSTPALNRMTGKIRRVG